MSRRLSSYTLVVFVGILLGAILQPFSYLGVAAQPGCRTFTETGKTVCARFLEYWQQNGGLAQQGLPISNEFQEVSELNGQTYTVQYFERAVFEKHPENAPPYDVLLSQLGAFQFKRKYPNGEPAPGTGPVASPTASAATPPAGKVYGFGELIPLAPGITLEAYQFELRKTTPSSQPHMFWDFRISNTSGADWPLTVNTADITVRDNLGNNFAIDSTSAYLNPVVKPDKPFPTHLWIFTRSQQVFDTVKYFDLTLKAISGIQGPFVFRRYIQ